MDFSQKWFIVVIIIIGIWWLYQLSVENYLQNDPEILRLKNKLLPFFPEITNTVVLKGDKSYTLGKYKIHLCIEDENGKMYDDNMLTYVFLHELAHCINKEIGHGDKFEAIFQSLLDRAEYYNLYDPRKPRIKNYCSISKKRVNT
jgi:hypothetical protein